MRTVIVSADATGLADATGARLGLALSDAIAVRGRADVVLTGGTVGIALLSSLARSPLAALIDWTSVHVWWGDERFVPAGHADRNEGQAQAALLRHIPLPEENIHRIGTAGDFETAEEAAVAYAAQIATQGPADGWDVALFGMGPDGHVASLFPGHPAFVAPSDADALAVHDSPKPPPTRVTMSLQAINRAREVWVVAAGAEKATAVARALAGDPAVPASRVRGRERTLWLIDVEASRG